MQCRKTTLAATVGCLVLAAAIGGCSFTRAEPVVTAPEWRNDEVLTSYDVIVIGSDPEGVAAAVSSARNGMTTLLADGGERDRLGGLATLGWLNTIDMNYGPKGEILNRGIFLEWYEKLEGDSFDVETAADAFRRLTERERRLDVRLGLSGIEPIVTVDETGERTVSGITATLPDGSRREIAAKAVIDATQDADVAAAAGVPYTSGREDLGYEEQAMAATLMFRLDGVSAEVWNKLGKRLGGDGDALTGNNDRSAWGYDEMKEYVAESDPDRVRMRGLNLGRQRGGTALVNALQIFGVDPLDPASKREARALAEAELPRIVDELRRRYPEFEGVTLGASAPELYVRESRHIAAEYRLTIVDVCENRDQWDRIAFGSYPVDIQRVTPNEYGAVVCHPEKYAVPFRSLVPLGADGLLVVGRTAGFDSLAHGSARVIPVGMATGQAAGAAARVAIEEGLTFRELASSEAAVARLQALLTKQGMALRPFAAAPPAAFEGPEGDALRAMLRLGVAVGGYDNDFRLKKEATVATLVNVLQALHRKYPERFPGDPRQALSELAAEEGESFEALLARPLRLPMAETLLARTVGTASEPTGAQAPAGSDGDAADAKSLRIGELYRFVHSAMERLVLG
ncbi:FAD-dependent oxidoreductase [Paenibacillus sp.]|uniref:FAD-dependent oxidoreductase n=1 Tax=Paenibacillus sp. TaxID=58172 RepID=UPI0028120CAE|nr:FAD-dependent oxidoreductase [Paenibacillus sp.]